MSEKKITVLVAEKVMETGDIVLVPVDLTFAFDYI